MKRFYTVSQDSKTKIWYAHKIGFPYIPVFGSFCEKKSDSMEYAKMCDGLPHRVNEIEKRKRSDWMGCIETIAYDRFPKQKDKNYKYPEFAVGARVKVCFHYDTSKQCMGTIVRDDLEEPFETIIKLDDGRYLRAVECQYSYVRSDEE